MTLQLKMRCANGHEQTLTYGASFNEDMVHDHGVLMCGGVLRSLGFVMPGYPCQHQADGLGRDPLPGIVMPTCGAKVSFTVDVQTPPPAPSPPPVDRSQQTTLHGTPIDELREKQAAQPTGMHDDYIVLTAAERAKGFVRPVRHSYRHTKCGSITTMGRELAETYARDPSFYSATYCVKCGAHYPVGADGEFEWINADGSDTGMHTHLRKVGT